MIYKAVAYYVRSPLVQQATRFQYTEPQTSQRLINNYRQLMADFVGDYGFVCPAAITSDGYAKLQKSVYRYQFNHRPSISTLPPWMEATHSDDNNFVFGTPLASWVHTPHTADEKLLSLKMVTYWTNFAKSG